MKKSAMLLAGIFIVSFTISAQPSRKKMLLTDVFMMATDRANTDSVLRFENVEFSIENLKRDDIEQIEPGFYLEDPYYTFRDFLFFQRDSTQYDLDSIGRVVIEKRIEFIQCGFPATLIRDFVFRKGVFIRKAKQNDEADDVLLTFSNCYFESLNIGCENDDYQISVVGSHIRHLVIYHPSSLSLFRNRINYLVMQFIDNPDGAISIAENEFATLSSSMELNPEIDSSIYHKYYNRHPTEQAYSIIGSEFEFLKTGRIGGLEFSGNKFSKDKGTQVIDFTIENLTVDNLIIKGNYFGHDFNLVKVNIPIKFIFQQNAIQGHFGLTFTSFSETQNVVDWAQLKGFKVALRKDFKPEDNPAGYALSSIVPYYGENDLELQDLESFEMLIASYRAIYDVYKQRGDVESANACYAEMKDIQTKRLGYVYRTEGGLKNLFRWKLGQLMKGYTEHGTDPGKAILISFYILIAFAIFYFFFPSEWDKTSKPQLIADFRLFIEKNEHGYVRPFFKMVKGLLLSFVNAITLSLNAFVTLGFGSIPTTGIARYVCVLQGFIGWFLLSLFSVALINQVLF